jgi:hypothetical protein
VKVICKTPAQQEYFGYTTPADARRVEAYHRGVHGVANMIGSLDSLHFCWVMAQSHIMRRTKVRKVDLIPWLSNLWQITHTMSGIYSVWLLWDIEQYHDIIGQLLIAAALVQWIC